MEREIKIIQSEFGFEVLERVDDEFKRVGLATSWYNLSPLIKKHLELKPSYQVDRNRKPAKKKKRL